jgi:hypothetical protein
MGSLGCGLVASQRFEKSKWSKLAGTGAAMRLVSNLVAVVVGRLAARNPLVSPAAAIRAMAEKKTNLSRRRRRRPRVRGFSFSGT